MGGSRMHGRTPHGPHLALGAKTGEASVTRIPAYLTWLGAYRNRGGAPRASASVRVAFAVNLTVLSSLSKSIWSIVSTGSW